MSQRLHHKWACSAKALCECGTFTPLKVQSSAKERHVSGMRQANTSQGAGRSLSTWQQCNTWSGKEILQGTRHELEGIGQAPQSTLQDFGGTGETLGDTGPGAVTVWPHNKAGKLVKSLPALGETSQARAWKIHYTTHCMCSDNTRRATWHRTDQSHSRWKIQGTQTGQTRQIMG